MFQLHPRLDRDTVTVATLELSRVLLMNDQRFPWTILVPERLDVSEIHDLGGDDRVVLIEEIARVSDTLMTLFKPRKINVGALGNMVPQLHIHVVARSPGDVAWPGPVWGCGEAVVYGADALTEMVERLGRALERYPTK